MGTTDFFNLTLLESQEEVDQINKKFYGRYNYPWPPYLIPAYSGNQAALFVNQDIGSYNHDRLPEKPKIWVAGCGTNQALMTALRFPEAQVFGTDISTQSLQACNRNAKQIGVKNLQLEEKSLNDVTYVDEFDYIICTGVVHHNANPEATLARISRALKKDGIFEFMVYNYYHRLMTTACQKAIRCFYNSGSSLNLELELTLIKNLMSDFHYPGLISEFLKAHMDIPEAQMVDNLIQPVEYSYTVESLGTMMDNCNLGYLHHCQNQFDVFNNAFTWNMEFKDDFMREHYYSLPDARRWQVANLLLLNNSPMLWFYVQRKDSGIERKSEQQLCEEFLETKFQRNTHQLRNYVLSDDGTYKLSETPVKQSIENSIVDPKLRMIYKTISPNVKMKEVLHQLNMKPDFFETNTIRIKLTTSGYPHLVAVH